MLDYGLTHGSAWAFELLGRQDWQPLTMSRILGVVFSPIAWLMGVEWKECSSVGQLLGVKMVATELVAYSQLRCNDRRCGCRDRSHIVKASHPDFDLCFVRIRELCVDRHSDRRHRSHRTGTSQRSDATGNAGNAGRNTGLLHDSMHCRDSDRESLNFMGEFVELANDDPCRRRQAVSLSCPFFDRSFRSSTDC